MIKGLKVLSTFETKSEDESIKLAYRFAKCLKGGDLLLLVGDIGAGKTTFLNGILKYLGSKKRVISSSFVLVSFYKAKRFNLVHCDLYRVNGRYEISEIIEYLDKDNIVAIEWPYDIKRYLPFKPYIVRIGFLGMNHRLIEVFKYD